MADTNDPHFSKIFWYISASSFFVFLYIAAITFLPIPKDNQRFADTILGFLLGTVLAGGAGYLVGGTPQSIKKSPPAGTSSAEISATITTDDHETKVTN